MAADIYVPVEFEGRLHVGDYRVASAHLVVPQRVPGGVVPRPKREKKLRVRERGIALPHLVLGRAQVEKGLREVGPELEGAAVMLDRPWKVAPLVVIASQHRVHVRGAGRVAQHRGVERRIVLPDRDARKEEREAEGKQDSSDGIG